MSECTHDCASCKEKCASPEIQVEKPNKLSSVKKVIGVVSGKGGVGKSLVSALLASGLTKKGYRTAVLDADLTGPSIPKVFGLQEKAEGCEDGILPALTRDGVQVMSINLLLEDPGDPVVWRGPVIAGTVKQFWTDVIWSDVDFMFVDMPPGTGDVPLTVFQSLPVDGIVVVASPQELVAMIVEKAVRMASMMNVPILGLVENMAWFTPAELPQNKYYLFGKEGVKRLAEEMHVPLLGQIPIVQSICENGDNGTPEVLNDGSQTGQAFMAFARRVVEETGRRNAEQAPTKIVEVKK